MVLWAIRFSLTSESFFFWLMMMQRVDKLVVLAAAGVALAVSVLTAVYPEACTECLVASFVVRSVSFSWLGVVFYGALIAVAVLPRWRRLGFPALGFAAGTHGVLLYALYQHEHWCWLCVTAATAVGVAFLWMLARQAQEWGLMLIWLGIGTLTSLALIEAGEMYDDHLRTLAVVAATEDAEAHVRPGPGQAALVVYLRPGCHHCEVFEKEDLPRVRAEFGDSVLVALREPPEDLPSPTVMVLPGPAAVFLGRPELEQLRAALQEARRGSAAPAVAPAR